MGYSNVTEEYIVSIKVCSEVEVPTVTDSSAFASMGAFVETGILVAVAGVTVCYVTVGTFARCGLSSTAKTLRSLSNVRGSEY